MLGRLPASLPVVYEGTRPSCRLTQLEPSAQYYWQVDAVNSVGVLSRSPLYSFRTIGPIRKAYNYPNPFNPAIGETTGVVFTMTDPGDAELSIFTEMGDLCWHMTVPGLPPGVNEIRYNGRDDQGRIIYNGTYVCVIKKNYQNREEKELCRMLVVK
jgi:hypothetical protein